MKKLAYTMGTVLSLAFIASANCGLDHCPRLAPGENPFHHSVSLQIKNTAFTLDSGSGHYQEIQAGYEYAAIHHWIFGGTLPVIALTTQGETHFGISNPLLYSSWYSHLNKTGMFHLGLQLELPLGNEDAGMATDHLMLVPYALIEQSLGQTHLLGSLGYSQAFALHHDEGGAEHPLYVNPHEDREILYRIGTGFQFLKNKLNPHLFLNGSYAIVDELEGAGRSHLVGIFSLDCKLSNRLILIPSIEFPLSSPNRFDWDAGVEAKGTF